MPSSFPPIPRAWRHAGLVIPRAEAPGGGGHGSVAGDPCIVWDDESALWRMVLFYDPGGHAQAVCPGDPFAGPWKLEGPIPFANPEALPDGMHKPFLVLDPLRPGRAARVDGRYWLLGVGMGKRKQVWRAWSPLLAGPWTVEDGPLIAAGEPDAFDAGHVDAVTGYYFADRETFLYFYMGYPLQPQAGRPFSPHGSAQAAAIQGRHGGPATKLGELLPPSAREGHWAAGWVGGLQLLPGTSSRWIGLVNASPTPVDPARGEIWSQEPPPSLGGFAWCDEPWPVSGWHWDDEPIERIDQIPQAALLQGEGTNLWRHYLLATGTGEAGIFYNSGFYGKEQLYLKLPDPDRT